MAYQKLIEYKIANGEQVNVSEMLNNITAKADNGLGTRDAIIAAIRMELWSAVIPLAKPIEQFIPKETKERQKESKKILGNEYKPIKWDGKIVLNDGYYFTIEED